MGKPSKNLALPVASLGAKATVALNRARRAMPQQMNMERMSVSAVVRRPTQNAHRAGATPNDSCYDGLDELDRYRKDL